MMEMASLSEEMELEVRPGGMLVQRRDSDDRNHTHCGDSLDVVDVALGPAQREIHFPVQPTSFGELKRMVEQDTGSKIARQKLFGRKKKDEAAVDDSNLQGASTEDMKEAEESSKLDAKQTEGILKAMQAIDQVRFEVDKLAERVYALEVAIKDGTKVAEQEFVVAAELLMRQLLKLDMIETGGEARIQQRAEVLRIQKFHDSLDDLKAMNAKPTDTEFAVPAVKTNWEKFNSGMGSLTPPPPPVASSTKINRNWESCD
ncbi:BAG family molecular chaperone regulator 4 [Linum perenne]